MSFHFRLALLGVILLNGMVLGDDSTSSGALVGADGERNAPSRGGDPGCKSEGRARNGNKLVVLDSARTTPSETVRKSDSVVKRMSEQSSHSSRNEARNDHVGVGNELPEQPATSHKAQTSVDDKHGMKSPHARRPAASRNGEGGLTSKNTKESPGVVDRKKEFENMVSGVIAEEVTDSYYGNGADYSEIPKSGYPYDDNGRYGSSEGSSESGAGVYPDDSPSVQKNVSISESASSGTTSTASSSDSGQSSANGSEDNTEESEAPKDMQEKEKEKVKQKEEDGKEREEKQLGEQRSGKNSDGQETNNSSEDAEHEKVPSSGNSAFLSGSYSSVLLVAVACLCACAC
ncbi:hypothetical protein ERJ75_000849800 [Trypanosoma vivax]|uniref:Uncharacterized protein n=1 Tax=Trypanosoma vivax (strain Y486) TaxID=1055687 RepID=F9WSU8_TRYVY|nr:hypothetical protein ERJ75_000849800 [Trypanosoma vivax]CCD20637.1 hypothetical protein, conserved in T.vivax [Trypanosoma vivax Y486]|eukprot:CCD20637.1 hypothetical protein, conserved in T.vivax [Trypanosoma vivax Y486]